MRILPLALGVTLMACAPQASVPPLALPFATDTSVVRTVGEGVIYRYVWSPRGPWGIHVLDVDLSKCYSAVAVKGSPGAAGRKKPSAMLAELAASREVIGGVNADFFSLTGYQGIPGGAFISGSKVIVGPGPQPIVAIDSTGSIGLGAIGTESTIRVGALDRGVSGWNRPAPGGLAVYDANWGAMLDTASGVVEVIVDGRAPATVVRVDTTVAGAPIPAGGHVIVAGRNAQALQRELLLGLRPGDRVDIFLRLAPRHPVEAVGGRPMLALAGVIVPEVDTEGQVSFRARNPRTAVGLANEGRRLLLVVVDGRRPGYSVGMTLRETAELMLSLGARDAINLDGGGSSALVFRDPETGSLRVANRPSDATGERAVGNALGVVKGCR